MQTIVGCVGDLLVEIMRPNINDSLDKPGIFLGPYPSGASGIFINAVSKLGVTAKFIGTVGNDDFGKVILDRLRKNKVDISHIKIINDYTTGTAFVTYFDDGSRKFIYHLARAATGQIFPGDLDDNYIASFDYLHIVGSVMSVNEQCKKSIEKVIKIVESSKGKITFDPNIRPELLTDGEYKDIFEGLIKKSHIIFLTEEEIKGLTGEVDLEVGANKLLEKGPDIIAVKQGKKGSSIFTEKNSFYVPAFEVEEIDPTGAGDSYCAGFIKGIINKFDLKKTAIFANAVGALATTKKGPMEGAATEEEVNRFIQSKL